MLSDRRHKQQRFAGEKRAVPFLVATRDASSDVPSAGQRRRRSGARAWSILVHPLNSVLRSITQSPGRMAWPPGALAARPEKASWPAGCGMAGGCEWTGALMRWRARRADGSDVDGARARRRGHSCSTPNRGLVTSPTAKREGVCGSRAEQPVGGKALCPPCAACRIPGHN